MVGRYDGSCVCVRGHLKCEKDLFVFDYELKMPGLLVTKGGEVCAAMARTSNMLCILIFSSLDLRVTHTHTLNKVALMNLMASSDNVRG